MHTFRLEYSIFRYVGGSFLNSDACKLLNPILLLLLCAMTLTACDAGFAGAGIVRDMVRMQLHGELEEAFDQFQAQMGNVYLGDSKANVLKILEPTQQGLRAEFQKSHDSYQDGPTFIEIYYFRTAWGTDGDITDNEYMPVIFKNGKLTSIGWRTLGGPQTIGYEPFLPPCCFGSIR